MNTEPPTGDDLERMLVAMKRTVLTRAAEHRPQPRRRGRRAGIVIGVIAVLGLGATSGGVALGMIPQPFAAAPAPAPSTAPVEPSETPTPSSAPVVNEPTSTPTPTRAAFDLADPSTWTISGDEFGPVAIGGPTSGETDDLDVTYRHDGADDICGPEFGSYWVRDAQPNLIVWSSSGKVIGVSSWVPPGAGAAGTFGPTTADGIGTGSTLDEIRAAYPDAAEDRERSKYVDPLPAPNAYTAWEVTTSTGPVWFGLDADGIHVVSVDIGQISGVSCD